MIPRALAAAKFVPVPAGEKAPRCKWRDIALSAEEAESHLAAGSNLAMRPGSASGDLVDIDLDCFEAVKLAPIYLLPTDAKFGRVSKPCSHWLYVSPGVVYTTFGD